MSRTEPRASEAPRRFESFEPRLALSAHSIADLAVQPQVLPETEFSGYLQQTSAWTAQATNAAIEHLLQDYGFSGRGQTVAVIDSGIAWDHYALGGGYGAGHRVVGGWDFAENDANPYDDGPAGFHGTHVAGIIGSSAASARGVASGADLVGLRVFDDAGQGNLQWVEQALRWVHQHRQAFENPITTVNLSLGTTWNSSTVPDWATLEDEFAQLRQDGIFISVAAGNSFAQYQAAGVSYPAASPHVVPVASHDAEGELSDFSQRNSRSLVAPGENIRSTVPNHLFGGTQGNQYLAASGTSMAAPWVAGASAVLREAYEFMGQSSVNQDTLFQRFHDSADKVFDSITGGWYSRINLQRAISQVVNDLRGDTAASASSLGVINGGLVVEGTIGRTSDVDTFAFTAGRSGRMTLGFETTHDMQTVVSLLGSDATWSGNTVSFNVTAGQQYKFAVSTGDGIGHYRMSAEISGAAVNADWGAIADSINAGLQVNGAQLFQFTASQSGLLSLVGRASTGNLTWSVLDANQNVIHSSGLAGGGGRIDFEATAGETLFLKLEGSGSADLRLVNLVALDAGQLTVHGTTGADRIEIGTDGGWSVEVNGIAYQFEQQDIQTLRINGNGGNDRLDLGLDRDGMTATLVRHGLSVSGGGFSGVGSSLETIVVNSSGSGNQLLMAGSNGDDVLASGGQVVALRGHDFWNYGTGFGSIVADGKGGSDRAELNGSSGDERLGVGRDWFFLSGDDGRVVAAGFETVSFAGGAGEDLVNLHGTEGNDSFALGKNGSTANLGGTGVSLSGVERTNAMGSGGTDSVAFLDTAGQETLAANSAFALFTGNGFAAYSTGMENVTANSTGGGDIAVLRGSTGNDTAWMSPDQTVLVHANGRTATSGFSRVSLDAGSGGVDAATLLGTAGDDAISNASGDWSIINSWGAANVARGFDSVTVDGWGGADTLIAVGSNGADRVAATASAIRLEFSGGQRVQVTNVRNVDFDGRGGSDEAFFADLGGSDSLSGTGAEAISEFAGRRISARNIELLEASARAGQAPLQSLSAVDYLFMLDGSWR